MKRSDPDGRFRRDHGIRKGKRINTIILKQIKKQSSRLLFFFGWELIKIVSQLTQIPDLCDVIITGMTGGVKPYSFHAEAQSVEDVTGEGIADEKNLFRFDAEMRTGIEIDPLIGFAGSGII